MLSSKASDLHCGPHPSPWTKAYEVSSTFVSRWYLAILLLETVAGHTFMITFAEPGHSVRDRDSGTLASEI